MGKVITSTKDWWGEFKNDCHSTKYAAFPQKTCRAYCANKEITEYPLRFEMFPASSWSDKSQCNNVLSFHNCINFPRFLELTLPKKDAIKPIRDIMLRTLNGEARKHGTRPTSRFQLLKPQWIYYTKSQPGGHDDIRFSIDWFHKRIVAIKMKLPYSVPSERNVGIVAINRLKNMKLHVFKSNGERTYNFETNEYIIPMLPSMQREVDQRISIQSHII